MTKPILLALAVLGLASWSSAAEVGLGVSFKQNENTIYLPVKISPGLMIEGFLSQNRNSNTVTYATLSGPASTQTWSTNTVVTGISIFWLRPITENTNVYFGPRLGYISQKNSNGFDGDVSENRNHGYLVSPTLGFEYFPIKHLSIGGEVGYNYASMSGSSTSMLSLGNSSSMDSTSSGTVTAVMVRFYF